MSFYVWTRQCECSEIVYLCGICTEYDESIHILLKHAQFLSISVVLVRGEGILYTNEVKFLGI